jgi:hypothetical protein
MIADHDRLLGSDV